MFPRMSDTIYKIVIALQIIFVAMFLLGFVATFTEQERVKEDSREIITDKVVRAVNSQVGLAEELLNTKFAKNGLADYQIETLKAEIASYKQDPRGFVAQVTLNRELSEPPTSANPLKNALLRKIGAWKAGIKARVNSAFDNLILDLRIFSMTNVIGLLVAAVVLLKRHNFGGYSVSASLILSFVIASSAFSYADQSWLYSILVNSFYGYSYPAGIVGCFAWMFYEHYKSQQASET